MSGGTATSDVGSVGEESEDARKARAAGLSPERHDSKTDTDQRSAGLRQDAPTADSTEQAIRSQNERVVAQNATTLPELDTSNVQSSLAYRSSNHTSPASAGLIITTNLGMPSLGATTRLHETPTVYETPAATDAGLHHALVPGAGSSLRSNLSTSSMASLRSPGSASTIASPYLATLTDLTPLPSPLVISEFGSSWKRAQGQPSTPSRSRAGSVEEQAPMLKQLSAQISPASPPKKRKGYGSLLHDAVGASASEANVEDNAKGHTRTRSISDFVPEQLHNVRYRHITFGPGDTANIEAQDYRMQRERHLAAQRGLTVPLDSSQQQQLPTPPASTSSVAESDELDDEQSYLEDGTAAEYLEIHCGLKNKRRKFRQLRQLGQGTFSKVMLATRERIPSHPTPEIEAHLDAQRLVAVKIVEHGPAGGADEQRIETGLKREVEMLKSVSHPSLIHLKACEYQARRALLVLTYCPGGDLFELASQKREVLTPHMVQRIFTELVGAVRYLHTNWIVHRDIKLENVLVNLTSDAISSLDDPRSFSKPIVTLTDLGLSRRIPQPPEPPLLQTRCGSEDYAAPEILLGQPYDGRQTDAWALGILLYALMEGRLPFDAPPGKPDRSRNTHRIARCDWIWCRFGDEDGDWDPSKGADFDGARVCVDGLLKKVRMGRKPLEEIESLEWTQNGLQVPGGLKMRELDEDDAL